MRGKRIRINRVASLIKHSFFRYFGSIFLVIGTGWLLIDATWTSLSIVNYFTGQEYLKDNKYGWIIITVIPIVITILYILLYIKNKKLHLQLKEKSAKSLQIDEIVRFHRNIIEESFDDIYKNKPDVFKKDILSAIANEEWDKVIKIGKYGARLFLMLAQYDLRIEYGNMIVNAGAKINDFTSVAIGYIDCIGWSYVMKKEYGQAKISIKKGLGYISENNSENNVVLRCKAQRHLAGIGIKEGNIEDAKLHRDSFEKEIRLLRGRSKKIMRAYLNIINGDIKRIEKRDYEKAKEHYLLAYELFISCDDEERAVKLYYKLGQIDFCMNQPFLALKNYFLGYWLSDSISRIDEKNRNMQCIQEMISTKPELFQDVICDEGVVQKLCDNAIEWNKDINFYESGGQLKNPRTQTNEVKQE